MAATSPVGMSGQGGDAAWARIGRMVAVCSTIRLEIVRVIANAGPGRICSGQIAAVLALDGNLISYHLGHLKTSGMVACTRIGTKRLYYLQPGVRVNFRGLQVVIRVRLAGGERVAISVPVGALVAKPPPLTVPADAWAVARTLEPATRPWLGAPRA